MLRHLLNLLPTHIDAESFSNKVFKDNEQIKIPKSPQHFREKVTQTQITITLK